MGKILYVEDELKSTDVIRLFEKYLSEEEIENLTQAKRREKIKEVLKENPFIHVEYNFIHAIKAIKCSTDDFSFFIIDRNLYSAGKDSIPEYADKDVPQIIPSKVKPKCEGDYLFLILLDHYWKHSDPRLLLENFYFYTAYPPEEQPLSIEESLGELLLIFDKKNHVIEKNSGKENDFIKNRINKFNELVIKSSHSAVFEVFQKGYLNRSYENDLLSILKVLNTNDPSEKKKCIGLLRQIFEDGVLRKVVEVLRKTVNIEQLKTKLPEDNDKSKDFKSYIISLLSDQSVGNLEPIKILTFLNGTPNRFYPFKTNTEEYFSYTNFLLEDSYYRIVTDRFWKICSEISHGGKSENKSMNYRITPYTLPILTNILLDFIIWFKSFMDKHYQMN